MKGSAVEKQRMMYCDATWLGCRHKVSVSEVGWVGWVWGVGLAQRTCR